MKKIISLVSAFVIALFAVACGGSTTTTTTTQTTTAKPTQATTTTTTTQTTTTTTTQSLTVEGNDVVRTREDNRKANYEAHNPDGSVVETFKSLYEAIQFVVDELDELAYVTTVEGENSDEPLFVNKSKFSDAVADMFWYYSGGNQLAEYSPWVQQYWTNLYKNDAVTVYLTGDGSGLAPYYNGYDVVNLGKDMNTQVQVWHVCTMIETAVTVDLLPYTGITKGEYVLNLKEAEIYPTYSEDEEVYAYVGYTTADANYVMNFGLACDVRTGNWHYYSGFTTMNSNNIEIDTDTVYMTSTWNEEKQCYIPDENVKLTCELKYIGEDEDTMAHTIQIDFLQSKRTIYNEYEQGIDSVCGTVRFTAGMDVIDDYGVVDYMNGAEFKNLVITKATMTAFEEMQDLDRYGNFPELAAGVYDNLGSTRATDATFHTILYTPACITTDFSTRGRDVYSFSFNINNEVNPIDETLQTVVDLIKALPAEITEANQTEVLAAYNAYKKLSEFKQIAISENMRKKLFDACDAAGVAQ